MREIQELRVTLVKCSEAHVDNCTKRVKEEIMEPMMDIKNVSVYEFEVNWEMDHPPKDVPFRVMTIEDDSSPINAVWFQNGRCMAYIY